MKMLVTGATGFVGGALVDRLLAKGQEVRAVVRPGGDATTLEAKGAEIFRADLREREWAESAVDGVDGVYHVGGVYAYWSRDPSEIYRVNAGGTGALFGAAKAAHIKRVVYTSTVATLKWPGKGKLADESSTAKLDKLPGHYKRSKFLGEQTALELNGEGFEVVVVNPTAPFGPGDAKPTPTGRIIVEYLQRKFPGYVKSGVNVVDVDDVADGHIAAFEKGRAGERYILGGENMSLREIYDTLGHVTGIQRRPIRVPWLLAFLAGSAETVWNGRIRGKTPYIPVEGLRVARHPMYVDCSKAKNELGFVGRPAEETLGRAAAWHMKRLGMESPSENGTKQGATGVSH